MTRQAVWPQELIERRAAAATLLRALRRAEREDPGVSHVGAPRIAELRSQLENLPCPHWEVHQHAAGVNDWTCASCSAVITPEWVPLDEQERHLRRLLGRRTAA